MTSRRDNINIRGFGAPTLAPALRLPGDYGPWGRWGINQHGELAVVEQAQRVEQLTADRDRFLFRIRRNLGIPNSPYALDTLRTRFHRHF